VINKGVDMDEMAQVMQEFEQRLEEALENIEHDYASPDDIAVIRAACGKPKPRKNQVLTELFNEFGTIFRK
jgi:antitoxin component HigA of HigAB toxin-antitoxin module